jgi:hypothetical protein
MNKEFILYKSSIKTCTQQVHSTNNNIAVCLTSCLSVQMFVRLHKQQSCDLKCTVNYLNYGETDFCLPLCIAITEIFSCIMNISQCDEAYLKQKKI